MIVQVTLCEQLASYLTKFKPAAQSNAATTSSANLVVPQGMQVLKKKGKPFSCLEIVSESHEQLVAVAVAVQMCVACECWLRVPDTAPQPSW